jgi:hypothetical protein
MKKKSKSKIIKSVWKVRNGKTVIELQRWVFEKLNKQMGVKSLMKSLVDK